MWQGNDETRDLSERGQWARGGQSLGIYVKYKKMVGGGAGVYSEVWPGAKRTGLCAAGKK